MASATKKNLTSTHPKLEIRHAGKEWLCSGVFVERGQRPGKLQDVWMVGHSRRCAVRIPQGVLYVGNRLVPPFVMQVLDTPHFIPTCMFCAIESYGEHFQGMGKAEYLRPVTPELRQRAKDGLLRVLHEAESLEQVG